jgi:TolB-like protein
LREDTGNIANPILVKRNGRARRRRRANAIAFPDLARKPLPEIARALNVAAIVEGSVMCADSHYGPASGRGDVHLLAEFRARNLDDVLSMQSEVAESVAGAVC